MNPFTMFLSIVLVWAFVIWAVVDPNASTIMGGWQSGITQSFTWLYMITQQVWVLFIIILYFSPYAHMKMGKPEDEKEFTDVAW